MEGEVAGHGGEAGAGAWTGLVVGADSILRVLLRNTTSGRQEAGLLAVRLYAKNAGVAEKALYRDVIPPVASERYRKRLDLVGLQKCPYELADQEWEEELSSQILCCTSHIGTPGEYTREKLKAYKSVDAYNYFTSGWVGTCFIHEINREFSVLKTTVKPSQSLSNPPHKAWVAVKRKDGSICTAHCTCMAG